MIRSFTGYHMWAVMIAFFGTIIGVNFVMASYALGTFGGRVVENSYVASQDYNGWLAAARAQEARGWRAAASLEGGHVVVALERAGAGAAAADLVGSALHPVGRADDIALRFVAMGGGRFRSTEPLPAGRWNLHLTASLGQEEARFIEQVG